MTDVREATETLLADKPDLEPALRNLLALDADRPWTFADTDLDSGTFGEIVSRGIVEEVGDGYRIADREAVQGVLDGETADQRSDGTPVSRSPSPADALSGLTHRLDRRTTLVVAGALLVVFLARIVLMWGVVFRNGDIVLAGNDPYLYRYWGEQLVASDLGLLDLGSLSDVSSRIPGHDTLYVVAVWWVSALLGGDATAVGTTLAWTPVLLGVVTAFLVYLLSVRLTADRRIGLAAVLLLALTPTHAYRTALGFGDHHAFDYLWVALTALSLVALVGRQIEREGILPVSRGEWLAVAGLAVGIAAQAHSWRGGPLLSIPVGLYLAGRVVLDVRDGRSPLEGNVPVLVGLATGALLTLLPHLLFGWAPFYRAFAPTLLFAGGLVVVVVGVVADRVGLDARLLVGGEVVAGLLALGVAFLVLPEFSSAFDQLVAYFVRTGQSGIAETYSIFSGEAGSVIGPVLLFGFVFFLAVPYMLWGIGIAVSRSRPDWLAATTYGLFFLLLAIVQSRFAGQLSLFTAVFGGLGFLHLATLVEIAERPAVLGSNDSARGDGGRRERLRDRSASVLASLSVPDGRTLGTLVLLFLLVSSLGVVQTGVKQSQIAVDGDIYETATWIDGYADEQGQEYPENYVLSSWGRNRVYNYFVNGESESYSFARQNYGPLLGAQNPAGIDGVEATLDDHGVGYVVTRSGGTDPTTVQSRLHDRLGSRGEGVPGLARFRAVHLADGGSEKVFEYVDGARITGSGPANETLTVETDATVGEQTVTYTRQVRTNRYGDYSVTVPYAGAYRVGDEREQVAESAVRNGEFTGPYQSHWTFDEGSGSITEDALTNATGTLEGASWTDGVHGSAVSFDDGNSSVTVKEPDRKSISNTSFTVGLWVRGDIAATQQRFPHVLTQESENGQGYGVWAQRERNRLGVAVADESGDRIGNFGIRQTEFDHWTHIAFVVDRPGDELRLYRNGTLVSTRDIAGLGDISDDGPLVVGGRAAGRYATGEVDSIRLYRTSLNETEVRKLAEG
jgi:dolichyl-diphosphooligosaccharide--protein glycosyltransferase